MAREPQNTRYWFYYAQSCLDAVQDEEARSLCAKLMSGSSLPAGERPRVRGNLKLAHMALGRPLPGR